LSTVRISAVGLCGIVTSSAIMSRSLEGGVTRRTVRDVAVACPSACDSNTSAMANAEVDMSLHASVRRRSQIT
jgi:hypothetical protein